MSISRTTLFIGFVFLLAIGLFASKLLWLSRSAKTTGVYYYHNSGGALDQIRISSSLSYFVKGNDTIYVNSADLQLKEGDAIPIRYQTDNPTDARVMTFWGFWAGTIVYGGVGFAVILIAFLIRGIFPRGSTLELFWKRVMVQIK